MKHSMLVFCCCFAVSLPLVPDLSSAQGAQCAQAPRLIVGDTTCAVGQACDVTATLEVGGLPAGVLMKSVEGQLVFPAEIELGPADPPVRKAPGVPANAEAVIGGDCVGGTNAGRVCTSGAGCPGGACVWPSNSVFNVVDQSLIATGFSDGALAIFTLTCSVPGVYAVDLAGVTYGGSNGLPIAGDCGVGGTVACACSSDADCNDGKVCTMDSCDVVTGTCVNAAVPDCCATDGDCDDGRSCSGTETCVAGACQPGTPVDCNDNVNCTADSCDEATGCAHVADHGLCDNGLFCDGAELCDLVNDCQLGTPPDCNDGIDCTDDSCDEAVSSCVSTPIVGCCAADSDCDDGLFCSGTEACVGRVCQSDTPVDCNDNISCTDDSCSEAMGNCEHVPNHGVCDNGLFCDGTEFCDVANDCQPGTAPCPAGTCDETAQSCPGCNPADCDDNDPCTEDTCGANDQCVHAVLVDCCATNSDCGDDGNVCTDNLCLAGTCVTVSNTAPCGGDVCAAPGVCLDGVCSAGGAGAAVATEEAKIDIDFHRRPDRDHDSGRRARSREDDGDRDEIKIQATFSVPDLQAEPDVGDVGIFIIDGLGAAIYSAEIPASEFKRKRDHRTVRFVFKDKHGELPGANGLEEVIVSIQARRGTVKLKAKGDRVDASAALGQTTLALQLVFGDVRGGFCVTGVDLPCKVKRDGDLDCRSGDDDDKDSDSDD